jgi:Uncharacterised nucleotidyltransferase
MSEHVTFRCPVPPHTHDRARPPLGAPSPISVWISHVVAVDVLREVIARTNAAGIEVLPVKGAITARLLYDDVAERTIGDVDVRIRPRDFAAFRHTATAAGWRCLRVSRAYRNLVYDFPPLSLDVEGQVGPPGLCALSVDTMLSRGRPLTIAPGLRVIAPETHDHAVLLIVNAFKDKIISANAGALADLERIVRLPDFYCDVLVDRLVQAHVATIAWIVASWMESARNDHVWGAIRLAIETCTSVRHHYAHVFRRLIREGCGAPMSLRLLARVAADSWFMRAEALARAAAWEAEMWLRQP